MKTPGPTEHQVQKVVVDALRLAGFHVYETTAYRQKGSSGMDKGIADLLVSHPARPYLCAPIELKKSEKAPRSPEQKEAVAAGRYIVAWDPATAIEHASNVLLNDMSNNEGALAYVKAMGVCKSLRK